MGSSSDQRHLVRSMTLQPTICESSAAPVKTSLKAMDLISVTGLLLNIANRRRHCADSKYKWSHGKEVLALVLKYMY